MRISEIERLSPSGFSGGKEYLDSFGRQKTLRNLPGGSGLLYSITNDGSGDFIIKLWDPKNKGEWQEPPMNTERPPYYSSREWAARIEVIKQRNARKKAEFDASPGRLIGQLTLHRPNDDVPLKGALQVGTITVDEDYRGVGLAKSMYGIVLSIMKRPLVAGDSQTPGGRRNWVSLSQIPGVEMKGYVVIDDADLKTLDPRDFDHPRDRNYIPSNNKAAENRIDTIMGKLGGQYIGKSGNLHFFAFDVTPNATAKELKAHVDTNLSKVYSDYDSSTGLYAVWTGQ